MCYSITGNTEYLLLETRSDKGGGSGPSQSIWTGQYVYSSAVFCVDDDTGAATSLADFPCITAFLIIISYTVDLKQQNLLKIGTEKGLTESAGRENDGPTCRTWNYRTWKCRTWKWRTKNDGRSWNGGRKSTVSTEITLQWIVQISKPTTL